MNAIKECYKIIAFIGPTLTINEARQSLEDCLYLPPVKCGDILKALRLSPEVIIIIDGYFYQTAAVWHKEILYALTQGVKVYGASSMGVLRALELESFGMQGFGKIFDWYKVNNIVDDDEVIVLHASKKNGYLSLSEPMVNLRFTFEAALKNDILTEETFNHLIKIAKSCFYQKRTFENMYAMAKEQGICPHIINVLEEWLKAGHYIDQKKQDAIDLLKSIHHDVSNLPKITFNFSQSQFFNVLFTKSMTEPFLTYHPNLPESEQLCLASRLLGRKYGQLKTLAQLIQAIYYSINECPTLLSDNDLPCINQQGKEIIAELHNRGIAGSTVKTLNAIGCHIFKYYYLENTVTQETIDKFVKYYQVITDAEQFSYPIFLIAYLWNVLVDIVETKKLMIQDEVLSDYIKAFLKAKKLTTQESLHQWMLQYDLSQEEFASLIQYHYVLDYFVKRNNLHALGITVLPENHYWLELAIYLSGSYDLVKEILTNLSYRETVINQYKRENEIFGKSFLYATDFLDEESFQDYLQQF